MYVIRLLLEGVWAKIASYPCLKTFGMLSVGEDSIDQHDYVVFGKKFLSVNVLIIVLIIRIPIIYIA